MPEQGRGQQDQFVDCAVHADSAPACAPRRSKVVSKTEILESVWDPDFAGDVNIVEVYVGYLRKKIDLPFRLRHHLDRPGGWLPTLTPPATPLTGRAVGVVGRGR